MNRSTVSYRGKLTSPSRENVIRSEARRLIENIRIRGFRMVILDRLYAPADTIMRINEIAMESPANR